MSVETTRQLIFEYDYHQLYLYDQDLVTWPEDDTFCLYRDALDDAYKQGLKIGMAGGLVDLLMVRETNFEAALELEICSAAPELDASEWESIVEFPLSLPSGTLLLAASGSTGEKSVELTAGNYQARWSGAKLAEAADWKCPKDDEDANPPDRYRLQLWPLEGEGTVREVKLSPAYPSFLSQRPQV